VGGGRWRRGIRKKVCIDSEGSLYGPVLQELGLDREGVGPDVIRTTEWQEQWCERANDCGTATRAKHSRAHEAGGGVRRGVADRSRLGRAAGGLKRAR
jgi:hypothetical protein